MVDQTVPVLKRTVKILKELGWDEHGYAHPGDGLSIRSALLKAAQQEDGPWYEGYIQVAQALTKELGGIQYWEFGTFVKGRRRPRTHDEVVGVLESLVTKLESREETVDERADTAGPTGSAV